MQQFISHRIAHRWISYIYRGPGALVVAVAFAATPTGPPPSSGDQSTQNGDHERAPQVNWNK
jgi:hypothetical protein